MVFNPNLKNLEELKFEIKKNSLNEIVIVIIEDVNFFNTETLVFKNIIKEIYSILIN